MPDSYEATFEVEAQPIEINLELKQYVEVSERQRLVVLDYYARDWEPINDLYNVEILAETHTLASEVTDSMTASPKNSSRSLLMC